MIHATYSTTARSAPRGRRREWKGPDISTRRPTVPRSAPWARGGRLEVTSDRTVVRQCRRRQLRPWRDESGWGTTPSGRGADARARSAATSAARANVAGKVQDDPPHRALEPTPRASAAARRGGLRVGTGAARGPAPQFLEQHVRRQGQQHAELVGQEPLATRAGPAPARDAVPSAGSPRPPARSRTGRPPSGASGRLVTTKRGLFFGSRPGCRTHLGLDDHPPLALPQLRAAYRVSPYRCAVWPVALDSHPGLAHQPPRALLQARIARHRHDVLDLLLLEELEQLRMGEAAIQPHPIRRPAKGGAQLGQQAPQEPPRPRRRRVARPQHGGHGILPTRR